jgi:hypothetical protein
MSESPKTRSDLQDEYREQIAKLDAERKSVEEQALAEIEAHYKVIRKARFAEYVAARDKLAADQAAAAKARKKK